MGWEEMLESPIDSSTASAANNTIKRYAPPNQRNRLSRRKSGDRFDRSNNLYVNDGDKNQGVAPRNVPALDHGDGYNSHVLNENPRARIIALDGCSSSEAFQLLNDRWLAAMKCYDDPLIDLSERPVVYGGSGTSAWGQFRPPHQLITQPSNVGPSGRQMDFLGELRRAIRNANANSDAEHTSVIKLT